MVCRFYSASAICSSAFCRSYHSRRGKFAEFDEPGRYLVGGEAARSKRIGQNFRVERLPVMGLDERPGHLAVFGVGRGDDGALENVGCLAISRSTSTGNIFWPLRLMTSLLRPSSLKRPSSSMVAMSPVAFQPSDRPPPWLRGRSVAGRRVRGREFEMADASRGERVPLLILNPPASPPVRQADAAVEPELCGLIEVRVCETRVSMLPAATTTRQSVRLSTWRAASRFAAAVPMRMARSERRSNEPKSSCARRFKMTGTVVATVILHSR